MSAASTPEPNESLGSMLGGLFAATALTALGLGGFVGVRLQQGAAGLSLAIGAAVLPALFVVALLRLAQVSLTGSAIAQEQPGAAPAAKLWPPLALLCVVTASGSVLGSVLRATTHHTGLGGVTFAIAIACVAVPTALLALRFGRSIERSRGAAIWPLATWGACALLVGKLAWQAQAAAFGEQLPWAALVAADSAWLLLCAAPGLFFGLRVGSQRLASWAAPAACALCLLAAVWAARSVPEAASTLAERAVLLARCGSWLLPG